MPLMANGYDWLSAAWNVPLLFIFIIAFITGVSGNDETKIRERYCVRHEALLLRASVHS